MKTEKTELPENLDLKNKRKELEEEEKFYKELRSTPGLTDSDWRALDLSSKMIQKLKEEVKELEGKSK